MSPVEGCTRDQRGLLPGGARARPPPPPAPGRSSVVRSSRPLRPGRLSRVATGAPRARADDDAPRRRAGQLVLVARLEAELADVVADADLALRALDLLGRGRPDGARAARARTTCVGRQLLRCPAPTCDALDRLDLLGQRGRVVGCAQGHRLDELLGPGAPGGARERGAVHVDRTPASAAARRVDVLDRGAIDADPHDLARGRRAAGPGGRGSARARRGRAPSPGAAPRVRRGWTTVGAQTTFQCSPWRCSATRVR